MSWVPWLVLALVLAALAAFGSWHLYRFGAYHRRRGLPMSTADLVTAARVEIVDGLILGLWHVRYWHRDHRLVPESPRGPLVICVHGYTQNATNMWGIRRALAHEGRTTQGVSLHHRLAPMSWYVSRLERVLDRLRADHPAGVDVVCHSMGGIVLRMLLSRRQDLRGWVRRAVTLGSPHAGTAASRGFAILPEMVALSRRSAALDGLPSLSQLLPPHEVTTVAGTLDTIVYPVESALDPGAHHREVVVGIGHAGLLTRQRAIELVVRALQRPAAASAPPSADGCQPTAGR